MPKNKIRTNEKNLVEVSVQGKIMHPRFYGWEVTHKGEALALPSVGGIVYNVAIGDEIFGWVGDHIEPGVTATATTDNLRKNPNLSFNVYSCIGNRVRVVSGDAKGQSGVVTGHHGGVEHVMIDFAPPLLKKLTYDDKLLIHCFGMGLELLDHPDVSVMGLAPELLHAMPIKELGKNQLQVPVAAEVPAVLMGSGLGSDSPFRGDFDIQTSDKKTVEKYNLNNLRFGDLVAILDHQCHFGYSYLKGAVTIGVVIHGDSHLAGHGPGVQTIMTTRKSSVIKHVISKQANIGALLKLGRFRSNKK